MKTVAAAPRSRIRLEPMGDRWVLVVDETRVISARDRQWLRRFAATLRRNLGSKLETN